MADKREFTATSQSGNLSEALRGAVDAAENQLNENFFAWTLERISGTVGGFVNAHDVTVTISAATISAATISAATSLLREERSGSASQCGDWYAWHDRMPGKKQTLHVVGRCAFPTAGYSVELQPANPQGINPSIYLLNKVVHSPTAGDQTTKDPFIVNIHYREETRAVYTHVQIMPDNTAVTVQEVS
jgi:hypothetical protein